MRLQGKFNVKTESRDLFYSFFGNANENGWIVIRPESTKNYYRLHDNHGAELSEDKRWQKADILDGQAFAFGSAVIWKGNFTYRKGQCRPGGRDASIYEISNGARFCLYY